MRAAVWKHKNTEGLTPLPRDKTPGSLRCGAACECYRVAAEGGGWAAGLGCRSRCCSTRLSSWSEHWGSPVNQSNEADQSTKPRLLSRG